MSLKNSLSRKEVKMKDFGKMPFWMELIGLLLVWAFLTAVMWGLLLWR